MKKNILLIIAILFSFSVFAQNQPVLAIDGVNTTFQSGLSLPYWLKAGQTLNVVANASSVSIMEFTADSSTLKYSRVISLNSLQTVPSGKVWKIEAIGTAPIGGTVEFTSTSMPTIFTSPKTYNTAGTYSWTVPPNVTSICVEVWGGGGSGGTGYYNQYYQGGGGGGGGYGYQCFSVIPGTTYTVTVGGASGTSSLGTLISATGGTNGTDANTLLPGYGGVGGNSTAMFNLTGANGNTGGSSYGNYAGTGGAGANGGAGAINSSASGTAPGGGGSGGSIGGNVGTGAPGKVIIYW